MAKTVTEIRAMKGEGRKISMVTSYDYSMAVLAEKSGIDFILVGDSLGMTMLGYENTLPVTVDDMVHHTACVTRGARNTVVVGDMPFGAYHASVEDAVRSALRLVKEGGAQAVKLEGGVRVAPHIKAIVESAIPVQGHVGMTPQSSNVFGGFKVQGKNADSAKLIIEDALAVQEAGAFSMVIECVPPNLAEYITKLVDIPTIGIGAGAGCDGQVLVAQDMLAMNMGFTPKFVKPFAQIGQAMIDAYQAYDAEVKAGTFPAPEHNYKGLDDAIMAEVERAYPLK